MTTETKPPTPQSALLDAQVRKAKTELALKAHNELVASTKAEWGVADALAMKSEGIRSREYRAAEELAKQLQWLERKTDELIKEDEEAGREQAAAELANAVAGARIIGQALNGLDQHLQLDIATDLARWAERLTEYQTQQTAWQQASAEVSQLGGPAPRPEYRLTLPGLLVRAEHHGRGLGPLDVAATLAKLLRWSQEAPTRAAEEAAQTAEREQLEQSGLARERLQGLHGETARAQELSRLKTFYGRTPDGVVEVR